ncbi:MAG: hypothetical protein Q9208_007223 [Pyrenodesmia sp. 3 TL-2023]
MELFSNNTTTTADPSSLHDLRILLARTQALQARLASPDVPPGARLSDANIKSYMEDCKPRVVLIRCYSTVGLPVGCPQYMEEKVNMLAEPLSVAELGKHEERVEYLIGWVKERQEANAVGNKKEKDGEGEEGEGREDVVVEARVGA